MKKDANTYHLNEIEKNHILKVLEMEKGNKSTKVRLLGVSSKTLEREMKAWNALN